MKVKHVRTSLLLGFGLVSLASLQADEPRIPVTREASCRWTDRAPVIDGKLDDAAWASAEELDRFSSFWSKTSPGSEHATKVRLLWNRDALYFAAEMSDSELRSYGTKHNDHLWNGDVFEMFFKPRQDRPEYYEFQVNPLSVIFEVAFPARGAKVGPFGVLPELGMKAIAVNQGTLNRPGDLDQRWTVEGKIPWSVFQPSGGRPAAGSTWSFAICRYDYGPEGSKPVLLSSAPLTQPSFHRYEDYGRLTFLPPTRN